MFSSRAYRQDLIEHYIEYTDNVPIRVCAGTWNVNGQTASEDCSPWLNCDMEPPDIYAIGYVCINEYGKTKYGKNVLDI